MSAYPSPFDLRHQQPGPSGDVVEEFLSTYDSHQTRRNYRADLKLFFGEDGATRDEAAQVQEEDVVEFLGNKASSFARSTLMRRLETIKSFYRWLSAQDLIQERPLGSDTNTTDIVDRIVREASGDTDREEKDDGNEGDDIESGNEAATGGQGPVDSEGESSERESSEGESSEGESSEGESSAGDVPPETKSGGGSLSRSGEGPPSSSSGGDRPTGRRRSGPIEGGKNRSRRDDRRESSRSSSEQDRPPNAALPDQNRHAPKSNLHAGEESRTLQFGVNDVASFGGVPLWVLRSLDDTVDTVDLALGQYVVMDDLPAVLRCAVEEIAESEGGLYSKLSVRYDRHLSVRIKLDREARSVKATIRHDLLDEIVRWGPETLLPDESIPVPTLTYLANQGWALPPVLLEPLAPSLQSRESEQRPTWTDTYGDPDDAGHAVAAKISSALAIGFHVGQNDEVRLRRHL